MAAPQLVRAIEALLFVSSGPLTRESLDVVLGTVVPLDVEDAILELKARYNGQGASGVVLSEVAGGLQLHTSPDLADFVRSLKAAKPVKLSRAAMEALAIIAYQQPVTRAEVEALRGVDSGGVIRVLIDFELVKVKGRAESLGRPLIYGTTERFLHFFGLVDLDGLPRLREVSELTQSHLFDPDDAPSE